MEFNSVVVWMAGDTSIEGILRKNGEEISVPSWTLEQVQEFAYACAEVGVQVQAYLPSGEYYSSFLTGEEDDGLLFFRSHYDLSTFQCEKYIEEFEGSTSYWCIAPSDVLTGHISGKPSVPPGYEIYDRFPSYKGQKYWKVRRTF